MAASCVQATLPDALFKNTGKAWRRRVCKQSRLLPHTPARHLSPLKPHPVHLSDAGPAELHTTAQPKTAQQHSTKGSSQRAQASTAECTIDTQSMKARSAGTNSTTPARRGPPSWQPLRAAWSLGRPCPPPHRQFAPRDGSQSSWGSRPLPQHGAWLQARTQRGGIVACTGMGFSSMRLCVRACVRAACAAVGGIW